MKNRVNGFCVKKCFDCGKPTQGTTKFDHVEPKEKFFDSCILSILSILSEFVAFCLFSSHRGFIGGEVITLNFPTTSLKEFPQSTLSREDTRTLKEQQE